ncbi:nuclear transport factor 2 family protein [Aurantiacibacter flavus]|uniref:Nuclear transport factor 2 family protein n=1 Tax=Aurantiacibacter flavus TaxID=3145232 RepID=A0ABV0D0Q6_9SPHN
MRSTGLALAAASLTIAAPVAAEEAPPRDYTAVSAATAPVAEAYFQAYTSRDWDALEGLLADNATFRDPTATLVFGGVESVGREAMMERFRLGYAGITHMEFTPFRQIVSGDVALAEGALHWGLDLGEGHTVDSVTPMVIVLTLADGKVVEHRDYVDYAPFLAAVRKARAAG